VISRRLADALSDMSHWEEFDYVIINDDLDAATDQLESILVGEGTDNRAGDPELASQVKNILV